MVDIIWKNEILPYKYLVTVKNRGHLKMMETQIILIHSFFDFFGL